MDKSSKIAKVIRSIAINMVDIKNVCEIVKQGCGADLESNDYTISTNVYDGSVFQVDSVYTELVVKSDKKNITRKAHKSEGGYEEKRVRVYKLSLLSWDEETKSFPKISSSPFIIRQKIIDFKKMYKYEVDTLNQILKSEYATPKQKEQIRQYLPVFQELFKIEPFPAFYDEKYGFLVKRNINFTRIVDTSTADPKVAYENEIQNNVDIVKKSNKSKEEFKEEVIAEALHPKRVEYLIEKFGIEDGMSGFD
jgi:hypothetical protein